jgi:hypothetical protein
MAEVPSPAGEHAIQEYFITEATNVVHLFGSPEILLKIPSYAVFLDANVYPSIEGYLKDRPLDGIDPGLLYKEKLAIAILGKLLGKYGNLLILPPVAEEIDHMAAADLAQIRRKREAYEKLPVGGMNEVLDVNNRLTELGAAIAGLRDAFGKRAEAMEPPRSEVYGPLLALVKFLDENLGTKKIESREFNDTDERLVAAAFYQMLRENRNAAIYTRDEDVKRLVSTTYRFIRFLATRGKPYLGSRFDFTNIIVFKYHFEKGVFSRFFESQTTSHPEDFIFPSRLREQEKASILAGAGELVAEIEKALGASASPVEVPREKPSTGGGEKALRHIAALVLDEGRSGPPDGEAETAEREVDLEQLLVLAQFFGARDVGAQVEGALEALRQSRLEARIRSLETRAGELERDLNSLAAPRPVGIGFDVSQRLRRLAEEVNENLLERLVLTTALEEKRMTVGGAELGRIRKALGELERAGYDLHREKVVLPLEEIEAFSGIPIDRVVGTVNSRKIPHEGRRVFLDLRDFVRLILVAT